MPLPFAMPVYRVFAIAFMLTVPFYSVAQAQRSVEEKTDRIVAKAMKDDALPGMAVAVIQDGKVLVKKCYGVKAVTTQERQDDNTVFCIGSVSKAFTAIGVMLLEQEGKLSLNDPVKKYLKDLPEQWRNIPLIRYMTHTSGIPEMKGEGKEASFEQTIKNAAKQPMPFAPGARQQYNNFNFAIMGKVIESVTGLRYIDYMQQRVFQPLGMKNTGVNPATNNIALGHLVKKDKLVTVTTHFRPGDYGVASGGLQTTLSDFVALSQSLFNRTLLKKKALEAMWMPYSKKLSNTPGWHSATSNNILIIHKGGGGTGIGSVCDFKIVPSQNLFVVVMINKARNSISPADVTDDILQKCFNIAPVKGDGAGEGNER
ncbi:MAG: serine hydrolase domain-containing protein [Chitinophagaceae bacterium]